jgi:3-oxoacyl-[acyl-carrier-protein] synthase III
MKILNISYALPSKVVTNQDIIEDALTKSKKHLSPQDLDTLEQRIRKYFKMSGSSIRYHRQKNERAFDFAVKAGKEALAKAQIDPKSVDLLIYTGVARGWLEPATANLFQVELGLTNATCFDILDACASWIRSMAVADSFLQQGIYKTVMILTCELSYDEYVELELKSVADLESFFSGYTIGEAATATIVTADEPGKNTRFSFKTWGEKHRLCFIPLPNLDEFTPAHLTNGYMPLRFYTRPAELLSFTIKKLVHHFKSLEKNWNKAYDLIIGHAVSVSSTSRVASLLSFDVNRVFETHARFGNTVSCSLPLGLAAAEEIGKLKRGMDVLLVMGSAGVTTAFCSFNY